MNRSAKSDDPIAAIGSLLDTHEARVLGGVGLSVGYLCVLFTKIMNFTQPLVGVFGVVGLTIGLLLLGKQVDPRSLGWWARCLIVVFLAVVLTAPQLHDAWTVSVAEAQANSYLVQANQMRQLADQFVPPEISIGKSRGGKR